VVSNWSEKDCTLGPVASDWSADFGLVCGMKRGILAAETPLLKKLQQHFRSTDCNITIRRWPGSSCCIVHSWGPRQ